MFGKRSRIFYTREVGASASNKEDEAHSIESKAIWGIKVLEFLNTELSILILRFSLLPSHISDLVIADLLRLRVQTSLILYYPYN